MSNKSIILIDYENLMRGHREKIGIVMEKIDFVFNHPDLPSDFIINRAYAHYKKSDKNQDNQFRKYQIEPRQTIPFNQNGKNGADIRMVVDAMDILYSKKEVINFVFISGDSDFIHLYKKLKEEGKQITVFAEEQSLGQYISGYCTTIIIPKSSSPKPKIKKIDKGSNSIPVNKRDSQIKNILSGLHYFKKEIPLALFIWTVNYVIEEFNIKNYGFESFDKLLNYYHHQNLLKFNKRDKKIEVAKDFILPAKKLDVLMAPALIKLALGQDDKSVQFVPFGNHYKLLEIAVISLENFQPDDEISIYEYKKALMSQLDIKNLKIIHIEYLLLLLVKIGILELSRDNKCFSKVTQIKQEEILLIHNKFIREKCLESDLNFNKPEWQSILDKALK